MSTPSESTSKQSTPRNESYGAFVKRQFRKKRLGVLSVYFISFLVFIAVFSDFLANEKPIVASYKGTVIFPIVKQYGVSLGLTSFEKEMALASWNELKYNWAIFPPVAYSPETTDKNIFSLQERKPSGKHYFGTDDIGRDVLSGIIHGSRYALAIGLVAMSIALTIGIILGLLAGFYGGKIDIIISRLIEIVITFPTFFLIITIVAMVQQGSIWLIMGLIGFTNWTSIARFVRGEVLRVRGLDFITAATALGYSQPRVIFRHVLPNAIAPVLVSAAFGIAGAILTESALSFLGFGVPPTVVTWGSVLFRARSSSASWWLAVYPGVMIFLTVSAYNLIGDALRDATDPRLRN